MKTNKEELNQYQGIDKLLRLMAALRDRESGCPWDVEQTFETIAPYTIEEAYEVQDAIENGTHDDVCEELGDLLLQVVFQAQIATESGLFSFEDIAQRVADKMISRHPHVFEDVHVNDADDVINVWDAQKDKEKQSSSALDNITLGLPALMRAQKIQKKAMKAGFCWNNTQAAFDKLDEELGELKQAFAEGDKDHIAEEYGDVLFTTALLGRYLKQDAEDILRHANEKFIKRFQSLEGKINDQTMADLDENTLLSLWAEVKKAG